MLAMLRIGLVLLLAIGLASCKSAPKKSAASTAPEQMGKQASLNQPPERSQGELTPDIIYNLLLGEIASQRGEMEFAYEHELEAAQLTRDPEVAERAVRFAMHRERYDKALAAVDVWLDLAPKKLAAHQLAIVLSLKKDASTDVMPHMKAVVRLGDEKGENGYLNVMAALNRELKQDQVLTQMRRLVAEFPDSTHGRYALAVSSLMARAYDDAVEEGLALVSRYPEWPNGYLVLGRIYVAQGNKAKARELMAGAVRRLPDQPLLLAAYARMLIEAKELKLAYKHFKKIEFMIPNDEGANYWLGLILLELKKPAEAKPHFKRLLEIKKRTEAAAFFLGGIAEDEGQKDQAISWYRKVKRGEYQEQAQIRLVRLLASKGRTLEARDWLQGLRIQHPNQAVRLYLLEADMLQEYGAPEDVMKLLDESLGAHPDNSDLLYARGLFAATVNRLDILEQDMKKVLEKDPQNADALNALGYTLADQTNRYAEALELVSKAIAIKPESPAILDSMGWVQYRLGNFDEALKFLWKAYEKLPDPEIAAHLGEVLWITGDREQADKIWQGVLDVSPQSKHVLEAMKRLKP